MSAIIFFAVFLAVFIPLSIVTNRKNKAEVKALREEADRLGIILPSTYLTPAKARRLIRKGSKLKAIQAQAEYFNRH